VVTVHFVTRPPAPELRGAVLRYEGFAQRTDVPVRMRELPCTFVPIIIDLDAGWHISDGTAAPVHLRSFVAGVTDRPVTVEHRGSARCLQIDLSPLAARRLFGLPLRELANACVAVDDVFGSAATEFVERIAGAQNWEDRFTMVDAAISARLAGTEPVDPGVAWALHTLAGSGGTTPIGWIAGELGWSHRRLISRFRDAVGMAPKRVARIQRFERLSALAGRPAMDWAAAAAECGYADQAHLAREVRELAGLTPTDWRAGLVNFVQDAAVTQA
jgi:AraC-like DNA-binding protein